MRPITASQLGRIVACQGAAVLPAVLEESGAAAQRGTDLHRFLYRALKTSRTQALVETSTTIRDFCAEIKVDQLDAYLTGAEVHGELALVYSTATGNTVVLGEDIDRKYGEGDPNLIYMSIDLVTHSPERTVVLDFKTGQPVTTCRDNWQLRVAAMAVSQMYKVIPLMVVAYLREDGSFHFQEYQPDEMETDAWGDELRAVSGKAKQAEETMSAGRLPDVSPSEEGCRWCPCKRSCPAHVSVALTLREDHVALHSATRVSALQPNEVAKLWEWLQIAKGIVGKAEEEIETYVRGASIPLGDGRVLKAVPAQRESINPRVAYKVLAEMYGPDKATACVEPSITKASLTRELRNGAARQAIDAIREAGGISVREFINIRAVADE